MADAVSKAMLCSGTPRDDAPDDGWMDRQEPSWADRKKGPLDAYFPSLALLDGLNVRGSV